MNGVIEFDHSGFVEVDPTGRYGRYNEILGKGASKTVYKAFDEYEGIEVAWNQVKLNDFLQNPDDLERLYCEIHLLKTLKHKNIMKFYASWVDTANRNINFVTEMFTSGTLRQYRLKHRRVNIRAVKHWCRQILKGLLYLHNHDPPVIHRDLKCDNIFINGNQGQVKIGDLGLAAFLRKSHAARCVGTPEFMAPEVYAEEYNELVDIYAFGMCVLEMVTFDYPYSECTHPAQIYKKVISGQKPEALYKVKDPEVRRFVEKCLATVADRLSARELLDDPFLQTDDYETDLDYYTDLYHVSNYFDQKQRNDFYCHQIGYENEAHGIELFAIYEDDHSDNVEITIKGKRREDDGIFIRLRMGDKEGRVRNIYFPFDVESDTGLGVAMEMISELDLTDQDVTKIAEMIDGEIATLVPGWKDSSSNANNACSQDYLTLNAKNVTFPCSRHGLGEVHGRFEEITYQFEESEQCVSENAPLVSSQSDGLHYTDIWAQHEHESPYEHDEEPPETNDPPTSSRSATDEFENEIRQEIRWLKAKYQIQLRELEVASNGVVTKVAKPSDSEERHQSLLSEKHLAMYLPDEKDGKSANQMAYNSCSPEHMVTANSFYRGSLLPPSLHRATSLPVDAIDV